MQSDESVRPCERTYIINKEEITPDIINELASMNGFMYWVCDNKGKITIEDVHAVGDAVRDNWARFHASC